MVVWLLLPIVYIFVDVLSRPVFPRHCPLLRLGCCWFLLVLVPWPGGPRRAAWRPAAFWLPPLGRGRPGVGLLAVTYP